MKKVLASLVHQRALSMEEWKRIKHHWKSMEPIPRFAHLTSHCGPFTHSTTLELYSSDAGEALGPRAVADGLCKGLALRRVSEG